MKKRILVLSLNLAMFCIGNLAFAQVGALSTNQHYEPRNQLILESHELHSTSKAPPFWAEDFGGGFPSDWAIIDSSGVCPWKFTFDGSYGFWNGTQSNGTLPGPGINSATAANGFLICDIDSADYHADGIPGNIGLVSSYFGTSAIDCSGHGSVILKFDMFGRHIYYNSMIVKVSNDSLNWTTFDISAGYSQTASPNPYPITLNISDLAANQSSVYLQIGWHEQTNYFWMIDDISLSEADPYDVRMRNHYWGSGNRQFQYHQIPVNQAGQVTLYADIENLTGQVLNDVYSDFDVNGSAGTEFQGPSVLGNLGVADRSSFASASTWGPTQIGNFGVSAMANVTGQTDGNTSNNAITNVFDDTLKITDGIYAKDIFTDTLLNYLWGAFEIRNFGGNGGQNFEIGNIYEITSDDTLTCIQIGITPNPVNPGKSIYGIVYAQDTVNDQFIFLGKTDDYVVSNGDLGTIVTIPLTNALPVSAGSSILVAGGHYGDGVGGADDFRFAQCQFVEEQSVYGYHSTDDDFYWLYPSRAIMVRADFSCLTTNSIDEMGSEDISIYPNPASDYFTIDAKKMKGTAELKLFDLTGKQVMYRSFDGGKSISFSATDLDEGVYVFQVSQEEKVFKGRLEVIHR